MIEIGRPDPRAFISRCLFSVIAPSGIRYQVVWRQYMNMDGKLIGIGDLEPRKSSYMQDRIKKMRADYLRKMRAEHFKGLKKDA